MKKQLLSTLTTLLLMLFSITTQAHDSIPQKIVNGQPVEPTFTTPLGGILILGMTLMLSFIIFFALRRGRKSVEQEIRQSLERIENATTK